MSFLVFSRAILFETARALSRFCLKPAIIPPMARRKASATPTDIPAFAPVESGSESVVIDVALPVAVAAAAATVVDVEVDDEVVNDEEVADAVVEEVAAVSLGSSD